MPKITVARAELFRELEISMTDDEFRDLCFEFGLELDDITTEKGESGEMEIFYKVEVAANRYDLLCFEGLTQALKVFLGKQAMPEYRLLKPQEPLEITVHASTSQIRPFVVCAVLRNLNFTQSSYNSFIELQEKLHQNICRKRTLVAIGTHDLDTLKAPFLYTALQPAEIKFKALNQAQEFSAEELMKIYSADVRMKNYVGIIADSPVYPIIYDSNRVVLSMPPIINGDHSKITLGTKNVFIECTATNKHKAQIVLNTIIAAFSKYSEYTVESVRVVYDTHEESTPVFLEREVRADPNYVNSLIGITLTTEQMQALLLKMGLISTISEGQLSVKIPITRTDILHPCDVAEDIGIAFGYNNIQKTLPKTLTVGKEQPLNLVSDLLRLEAGLAGYTEILTFALHSFDFNYTLLRRPHDGRAAEISNQKALEFQLPRTTLLPGVLRTLACNSKQQLPLKVFELSDVVLKDESADVGAKNQRYLAAGYCGNNSGLENIHGLFDMIMKKLAFKWKEDYHLEPSEDPTFFPKRQVEIIVKGCKAGVFGIVHPEVLDGFGIPFPVSAIELDIQLVASLSRV